MDKNKYITENLIAHPVVLHYDNKLSVVQKIAGLILFVFFAFLGVGIFMMGLKAVASGVYYMLFGFVLCLFPFIVYFIIQQTKQNQIIQIDKNSVTLRNKKNYNWEQLKSIIYNTSLYETNESNRFVSVQFTFNNGKAIATYKADKFSYVLFIANNLQVKKMEISSTNYKS